MHRTNRAPRTVFWGLLLGLALSGLCGSQGRAQPAPLPPPVGPGGPGGGPAPGLAVNPALLDPRSPVPSIIVPINGTQKLQMTSKERIVTVQNQKDTVARVSPVIGDPTSVLITGLEPGITRVVFTGVSGRQEVIDVVIQIDVEYLRVLLKRAAPTAFVDPIPAANNTIILTGTVAHAEDIQTILATAQSVVLGPDRIINALRVGGVQQVQLCVVIARVARSELRQMAFGFFENGQHHKFDSTVGSSFFANAVGSPIFPNETSSLTAGSTNLVLGFLNDKQEFFGFLQALRTEGVAKILAEPRLTALSGRTASFLDGGEQAVPVPAGLGQIGVQFEEFGTRLNVLPIVLGNGKIHLEVEPEVSILDAANGVSIQGTTVPGRATQRVHTTVEMEDGQTLMIGGLIQHTVLAQAVKVPVVGDLPFLGAAFSTKQFTDEEHELVILVTPHLVDPMACDQLPKHLPGQETRNPDDFELFLEGILEAPRGQRDVFPDGTHYEAAWTNGPTAGTYPCAERHPGAGGNGGGCGAGGCGTCGGGEGGCNCGQPAGPVDAAVLGTVASPTPTPGTARTTGTPTAEVSTSGGTTVPKSLPPAAADGSR
jgi:pilus assembly protein CpaC